MSLPVGVILAGGQATRMGGGDKGRLMLGQRSLLDHVIDRLRPQVSSIILNANGAQDRFSDLNLPVISDSLPGYAGPLAGVLAGLDWAYAQGSDHVVSVAADTPFFPKELVQSFLATAVGMETPLVLAATIGAAGKIWRQPTFGLWPVVLRDDLRKNLENGLRKVVIWTDQHGGREAIFETDSVDPFFNVNTPDDLLEAQGLLQNHDGGGNI
jgi:molybdopterin-guanine dinucleotide biosynthesis protein A